MKFITSLAVAAVSLSAVLAPAQAASYHSAFYFDEQRALLNVSHETITQAVLDKTIVPEVVRVQTETSHGVKATPLAKFTANVTAVQRHCEIVQNALGQDASGCKYTVDTKEYPTISAGF